MYNDLSDEEKLFVDEKKEYDVVLVVVEVIVGLFDIKEDDSDMLVFVVVVFVMVDLDEV